MAYTPPLKPPLTQTQSELIAKISAMKSLVSIPRNVRIKVPKREQMSIYDYILLLLAPMGINPEFLFKAFLQQYLTADKINKLVIRVVAKLAAQDKKSLNPNVSVPSFNPSDTADQKSEKSKQLEDNNYNYLISNPLIMAGLTGATAYLVDWIPKRLIAIIFGKKAGDTIGLADDAYSQEMYKDAVCGSAIFSLSSDSNKRNEDIYFNVAKLQEQLQKGDYNFNISCQGIEVSIPENPDFLFNESAPGQISSSPRTPAQSLSMTIDYIASETQRQRGESRDSNSAAREFSKTIIEKLVVHIMIILKPLFTYVTGGIPGMSTAYEGILQVLSDTGIYPEALDYVPMSSCAMLNQFGQKMPDSSDPASKGLQIAQILTNTFFHLLVAFMFRYLLKSFKKLVASFLAKRASNKLKQRTERIKNKNALFFDVDPDKIERQQKYVRAIKPITKFIEFS